MKLLETLDCGVEYRSHAFRANAVDHIGTDPRPRGTGNGLAVVVLGEHHNGARCRRAYRLQTFECVPARRLHIDDDDIGIVDLDPVQQVVATGGEPHNLATDLAERLFDRRATFGAVIHQQHPEFLLLFPEL